jgi:hypothetical protein
VSVSRGWQGLTHPMPYQQALWGLRKNLPEMRHSVISCAYNGLMETTQTFINSNTKFKIVHIMEHTSEVITSLGWSHFAAVQRMKGHKTYYANLMIVDGEILHSTVVM